MKPYQFAVILFLAIVPLSMVLIVLLTMTPLEETSKQVPRVADRDYYVNGTIVIHKGENLEGPNGSIEFRSESIRVSLENRLFGLSCLILAFANPLITLLLSDESFDKYDDESKEVED